MSGSGPRDAVPGSHEGPELCHPLAQRPGPVQDFPGDGGVSGRPAACGLGAGEEVDIPAAAVRRMAAVIAGGAREDDRAPGAPPGPFAVGLRSAPVIWVIGEPLAPDGYVATRGLCAAPSRPRLPPPPPSPS